MDKTNIGAVILSLRKQRGMTREQLAEAVGVSPPAVSKWETCSNCPDVALLAPIARALDTDVNTLLSFTPHPLPGGTASRCQRGRKVGGARRSRRHGLPPALRLAG